MSELQVHSLTDENGQPIPFERDVDHLHLTLPKPVGPGQTATLNSAYAVIVNHVTVTSPTAWSTVYTKAKNSLNLGRPYIVGMKRADTSTHFFVIKGYVNSGTVASDFTINDPAGGVARSLSYYTAQTPYRGVSYYK